MQFEEAGRYVIDRVITGDLRVLQAAKIMGISQRHTRRLLAAYRAWERYFDLAPHLRKRAQ